MSTPSPIPAAVQAAATEHCGRDPVLTEVTHRRGSAVWKAAGHKGTAALKVGSGDGVEFTAREAAALAALGVDYFGGGGVTHGAAGCSPAARRTHGGSGRHQTPGTSCECRHTAGGCPSPASWMIRATWTRLVTSSLARMLDTWALTVGTPM